MSRKVKVVKKNLAPAAKPLGVNPMDPWSTKAGITEASEKELLHRFLDSRGINPEFVSRETKIAHSKSGEFMKWRKDHEFTEEDIKEDLRQWFKQKWVRMDTKGNIKGDCAREPGEGKPKCLPQAKAHSIGKDARASAAQRKRREDPNPERRGAPINVKTESVDEACWVGYTAKGLKKKGDRMVPNCVPEEVEIEEAKTIQGTALDKFRQAAAERAKKHDDIEREMKARHAAGKEDMKGSIDRLEKHLNKEEAGASKTKETQFHKKLDKLVHSTFGKRKDEMKMKEEVQHKVGDSVTVNSKFFGKQKGKVTKIDNQSIHVQRNDKKTSEKYPHDAVVKEEMIDEISKSTLSSYKDKSSASLKNAQANRDAAEPGKNMSKGFADLHAKSDAIAKKRVKGLIGYMQRKQGLKPMGEDVYQDSQAATQTAFDMGTTPNQTEPTSSRRKEMSKSARIIKSIYKNKKMVKEEMYDHEKEDKSVQTYGKKPKMAATDKKDSFGEEKPDAAAIMSGGTTLTGEKRDNVEIDPMMRNKPGQNVFNKEFGKKGS
jgi:hypothetical protein